MKRSFGFTMIELLVVIAVIGVLAVAVLSSINPVEQINKGRDTRVRSNAAQMLNAVDRYYAIQEIYPWNDATYMGGTDTLPSSAFPGTICNAVTTSPAGFCQVGGVGYNKGDEPWLTGLSETEEVKSSFISQVENTRATNALYLYKRAAGVGVDDSVYVCFTPSSNAFQIEAVNGCAERKADLPPAACSQPTYDATTEYDDELICLP